MRVREDSTPDFTLHRLFFGRVSFPRLDLHILLHLIPSDIAQEDVCRLDDFGFSKLHIFLVVVCNLFPFLKSAPMLGVGPFDSSSWCGASGLSDLCSVEKRRALLDLTLLPSCITT